MILVLGFLGCSPQKEMADLEEKEEVSLLPQTKELLLPATEIKGIKPNVNTYQSYQKRDPFVPLIEELGLEYGKKEEKTEATKAGKMPIDIKSISLIGIITDKKESLALLYDSKKNGYILKRGELYDDHNNKIAGISGAIRQDHVIISHQQKDYKVTLTKGEVKKEEDKSQKTGGE